MSRLDGLKEFLTGKRKPEPAPPVLPPLPPDPLIGVAERLCDEYEAELRRLAKDSDSAAFKDKMHTAADTVVAFHKRLKEAAE